MSTQVPIQKIKAGVSGKKKRRVPRVRGVRYERAGEVVYLSLAQARKLVASGKAVVDVSRTRYAIRERFRQHGLGNTKHHAEETFDHYNTHVVIDPDTRMFVCPANPPSEHAIRRAKELLREAGRKQDAAAMDRQRVRMAEISLGMRPRIEVPRA